MDKSPGFIKKCILQELPGILRLIKAKNFHPTHPENHNIQKENKRDEYIDIFNGKEWESVTNEEAIYKLMQKTFRVTEDYLEKLLEPDEISDEDVKPLEPREREQFIRTIQKYLQLAKLYDTPIDESYWRTDKKNKYDKSKIQKQVDELIYRHSDNNQMVQMQNHIKALQKQLKQQQVEINQLKAINK